MNSTELIIGHGEGIRSEEDWGVFEKFDGFVGWGEGIRSAEDVDYI